MSLLTVTDFPSVIQPPARRTLARGARPLITIAIPAFNRPQLLRDALASVASQRDFNAFEVVVCDDGRLPETARAVEECGLRNLRFYVNPRPLGAVANWNRCIDVAEGQWISILHEDDLLYPWFLRLVADELSDDYAALAVRCVQGATPPRLTAPRFKPRVTRYAPLWFLKSSMTPFPGVVFSRAVARRIGGFDPAQGGLADYTFWYELARVGPIGVLRTPAAFYRVESGQWTEREWPSMLRRAHLLRLRIARDHRGVLHRGRWIARYYTARMARSYRRRFADTPAVLQRAQQFERMPGSGLPSGWVWAWLKWNGRQPVERIRNAPAATFASPVQ